MSQLCIFVLLIIFLIVGFTLIKWGLKILFYPVISLLHQASLRKWGWFLITLLCMIPGYALSYIPAIFFELFIPEHVEEKQMHREYRRLESKLERNKKAQSPSHQHIIRVINRYILRNPDLEHNPFYLGTTIPSKKLTNARAIFAPNIKRKDVIFFIDLTVWGSGKKGVLLTGKSVYWDDDDSKGSLYYSEITHSEKKGGPAIFLNSEKLNLYMLNNKEHRTIIFDMIQDIIEADKKYRPKKFDKRKGGGMSKDRIASIYNKLRNGVLDRKLKKEAGLKNGDLEVIHLAYQQYGEKYGFKRDMMKDITNVRDWLHYYRETQKPIPEPISTGWIEEDDWEYETGECWDKNELIDEEEENWEWN